MHELQRPVRVVHLLKHAARNNGHVHVAVDLACAQADAGHEVAFVAARSSFTEILQAHGVTVVDAIDLTDLREVPRAWLELRRFIRRWRPDLIHSHMMSSAVLAYPMARLGRIPVVNTMHNSFERHSFLMRLGTVVVAVSEAERTLLLSRGYRADRVVTIVNGADGSAREVEEVEYPPFATPCVVTLSGLHERKDVGTVIAAFGQVAADFPDWHLNVVGAGPDRQRLEGVVAGAGLEGAVHFLGSTPAPRPLLDQADIFATATLADPCPLSVMEARASGCAIVATDVGGIPETLAHGAAGHLVPVRDPGAMATALRQLMGDADVLQLWKDRALAGAGYFSVARMADDYVGLYRALVAGQRR